jgi:predicted glutamine amidotransferase
MFMHNGGIGCFKQIKRRLAMSLNEQWFTLVQGSTDSEWAFATFLDCLDKAGVSPNSEVGQGGFGHTVLRKAMLKTIARINSFIKEIVGEDGMGNEDSRSLLNFAVTDGASVVCTRYVSSKTDEAASLFFSSGTSWKELKPEQKSNGGHKSDSEDRDYVMERRDKGSDIVLVASEPLTFERGKLHTSLFPFSLMHGLRRDRQLGDRPNQQHPNHLQANRHDTSNHRRILLAESSTRALGWLCSGKGSDGYRTGQACIDAGQGP